MGERGSTSNASSKESPFERRGAVKRRDGRREPACGLDDEIALGISPTAAAVIWFWLLTTPGLAFCSSLTDATHRTSLTRRPLERLGLKLKVAHGSGSSETEVALEDSADVLTQVESVFVELARTRRADEAAREGDLSSCSSIWKCGCRTGVAMVSDILGAEGEKSENSPFWM